MLFNLLLSVFVSVGWAESLEKQETVLLEVTSPFELNITLTKTERETLIDAKNRAQTREFIPASLSSRDFKREMFMMKNLLMVQCGLPVMTAIGLAPQALYAAIIGFFVVDGGHAVGEVINHDFDMNIEVYGDRLFPFTQLLLESTETVQGYCTDNVRQFEMYRAEAIRRGLMQDPTEYTFGGDGNSGP